MSIYTYLLIWHIYTHIPSHWNVHILLPTHLIYPYLPTQVFDTLIHAYLPIWHIHIPSPTHLTHSYSLPHPFVMYYTWTPPPIWHVHLKCSDLPQPYTLSLLLYSSTHAPQPMWHIQIYSTCDLTYLYTLLTLEVFTHTPLMGIREYTVTWTSPFILHVYLHSLACVTWLDALPDLLDMSIVHRWYPGNNTVHLCWLRLEADPFVVH
jgi:hypothetical protein